jgi:hypothetical protein
MRAFGLGLAAAGDISLYLGIPFGPSRATTAVRKHSVVRAGR